MHEMEKRTKVELGCGNNRRDIESWENIGIDLIPGPCVDHVVNLGFKSIPLEDNSVDLVQAYDVFEHIPKCVWLEKGHDIQVYVRLTPFIHLMNEIWRILKHDGELFCEIPFSDEAFNRDPTHVNRFSKDWALYFSKEDNLYYDQGLVKCNFGYVENTYARYRWTDEDIMKTRLRAIKKEEEPLI